MRPFLHRRLPLLLAAFLLGGCAAKKERPGVTTVEVWSGWAGAEGASFQTLVDRFNREHPKIFVHNLGGVTDSAKITRAITAGVPPDMFTVWSASDLGPLAAYGALRTLDAPFKTAGFHNADFAPAALKLCRYNGRLYAMPLLMDANALLWNKDAFRAAGLDPDSPPRTLDEMKAYAARLTLHDKNGEITRLGMQEPDSTLLAFDHGGGFIDAKTGAITANRPENVEALAYFKALEDAMGGRAKVESFGSGFGAGQGPNHPFFVGKVAMLLWGEWMPSWCEKYAPTLRYGVAPVPYDAGRPATRGTTLLSPNLLAIPTEAKHGEAAWQFLAWLQSPAAQTEFAEALNNVPNTVAALKDPRLTTGSPRRRAFGVFCRLSQSPNGQGFPVSPVGQQYQDEWGRAAEFVLFGEKTPQQALDAVQAKITKELKATQ